MSMRTDWHFLLDQFFQYSGFKPPRLGVCEVMLIVDMLSVDYLVHWTENET